jgi:biopolymer transport protein ExbD
MLSQGILKTTAMQSVIGESSIIAPQGEAYKRSVVADLLLTALIDAFSILVIFLLVSFSATGDLIYMGKGMELPNAKLGETLDRNPVVKIEEGKLFLEDKEVPADTLVAALLELRKAYMDTHPGEEFPGILTIQADRRVKYEELNGIVLASSHAGFSDIKFAVVMK